MIIGDREAARERRMGLLIGGALALLFGMVALARGPLDGPGWALIVVGMALGVMAFRFSIRKSQHRRAVLRRPFPPQWNTFLHSKVGFYHSLGEEEQRRFQAMVMVFLDEVRITGIQTKVTDETRLLIAASAIIPIFGFPDWDYFNLGEILVFPGQIQTHEHENWKADGVVTGLVNSWQGHQVMKLDITSLERGFANMQDSHNVGIHEFAHVLDDADGAIDGVPRTWMPPELVQPWMHLMYEEIEKIKAGKSNLRPYGATNEAEFFAVATEYFFEHPRDLEADHPELYQMLVKIFRQDTGDQFLGFNFTRILRPYGNRIGRNAPCPCGSGKKFKHCCLE